MVRKMRSGINEKTTDYLFIGPGELFTDFTHVQEVIDRTATQMGATSGGNQFTLEREWHVADIDGALGPMKGGRWCVGATPQIQTNLLEATEENLKRIIPGSKIGNPDSLEEYKTIRATGMIGEQDYNNYAIVGELSGKKEPAIIVVWNGFITSNTDVNKGTGQDDVPMSATIVGHYETVDPYKIPLTIFVPQNPVDGLEDFSCVLGEGDFGNGDNDDNDTDNGDNDTDDVDDYEEDGDLEMPQADPAEGTYQEPQLVELYLEVDGTQIDVIESERYDIYWAKDESVLDADGNVTGTLYTEKIDIESSTDLHAISIDHEENKRSAEVVFTYTIE